MTSHAACLLCRYPSSLLLETIKVADVVREWQRALNLDISNEFQGISCIQLRRCTVCDLRFFQPNSAAGSSSLYEKLQKFAWYYSIRKWEHDVALEDLAGCSNGLEIGCGFGDFVARASRENMIPFEGCELNPSAVARAQANGLSVVSESSQNIALTRAGNYSAVCSFQVLEHVSDPASFLTAACTLLRKGGKLILGLPNAKSFLRLHFNALDAPPHHMTRWTASTLTSLQKYFPLKLLRIAYEPLADHHVEEYVDGHIGALSRVGLRFVRHPAVRAAGLRLIRKSAIQKRLLGQTIYACYLKT